MMHFHALLLALLTLPIACAAAPQEPQEREFSTGMLERLRAAMPGAELSLKPDEPLVVLVKKSSDWAEAQINLHRIEGYCRQASAADCEASKAEFISKVTRKPPKATQASLRVIVRDASYLDYLKSLNSESGTRLGLYEPIGEGLYVFLASDSADAISLVGDKTLEELRLTRAEAWGLARKQTRALLPPLPDVGQLTGSAVAYQDQAYLGSLLIDLQSWARLAAAVGPDLFVTVVSDSFVFVGVMPDGPDLNAFKQTVAEDCAAQQRCISPYIYRFRGGRWTPVR